MSVWGTVCNYLKLRRFSWKHGINHFPGTKTGFVITSQPSLFTEREPDLPNSPAYMLKRGQPTPRWPSLLRLSVAIITSAGILTCFPSTTAFALALGADSPCADERCAGTLGLSARGIFTPFIVTHVSIRTSDTSSMPYSTPSTAYRTLRYRVHISKNIYTRSFGTQFEPR